MLNLWRVSGPDALKESSVTSCTNAFDAAATQGVAHRAITALHRHTLRECSDVRVRHRDMRALALRLIRTRRLRFHYGTHYRPSSQAPSLCAAAFMAFPYFSLSMRSTLLPSASNMSRAGKSSCGTGLRRRHTVTSRPGRRAICENAGPNPMQDMAT